MLKCLYCNKELANPRAKYCNDAHRMAYKRTRTEDPNKKLPEQVFDVRTLTRQELYDAIDSYEGDTWVDSPEYEELRRRLDTMPLKQLRQQGYWL